MVRIELAVLDQRRADHDHEWKVVTRGGETRRKVRVARAESLAGQILRVFVTQMLQPHSKCLVERQARGDQLTTNHRLAVRPQGEKDTSSLVLFEHGIDHSRQWIRLRVGIVDHDDEIARGKIRERVRIVGRVDVQESDVHAAVG